MQRERKRKGERKREGERSPTQGLARAYPTAALKTIAFFTHMCVLEEVTHAFF